MLEDERLVGHRTVTESAVATFGGLTGDHSRIHFDHELGKRSPYGRGFAHGLLSASWALGALTLHATERLGCGDPEALVSSFRVRFSDVVRFGDTIALRWHDAEAGSDADGWSARGTGFAWLDQDGRTVTSGAVAALTRETHAAGPVPPLPEKPQLWPAAPWQRPAGSALLAAEDVLEWGPRGASRVRTVTEADVVGFANFTGELNPLYLDAAFAERALFGKRIAPPMLCFCLAFSVWLRELLRLPMGGGESSAGHLGDRWQVVAPVHIGDTLEVRYRPLSLRRLRSRPTHGVATFGLQLVNQHESVVQQGEVDMMLEMRDGVTGDRSGASA